MVACAEYAEGAIRVHFGCNWDARTGQNKTSPVPRGYWASCASNAGLKSDVESVVAGLGGSYQDGSRVSTPEYLAHLGRWLKTLLVAVQIRDLAGYDSIVHVGLSA